MVLPRASVTVSRLLTSGRRTEAESIRDELCERFDQEYVPPVTVAFVEMALGNADDAFDWLDRGYRERDIWLWTAKMSPWFDDFRPDPRFEPFLRRMNFPETAETSPGT